MLMETQTYSIYSTQEHSKSLIDQRDDTDTVTWGAFYYCTTAEPLILWCNFL